MYIQEVLYNIHPSLLPKYKGSERRIFMQQQIIKTNLQVVHYICDDKIDGVIILQMKVDTISNNFKGYNVQKLES